jgi:hypothetical protein
VAEGRSLPTDTALERELMVLGGAIDWPTPAATLPERVGGRLRASPTRAARAGWWSSVRPVRRALLAAALLVLLIAAGAAALTLLLPGLRIVSVPPASTLPPVATAAPAPSTGAPLGSALGLGTAVAPDAASGIAGFEPLLPADPAIGAPDETYVALRRLSYVWHASPELPEREAAGIGLVVTQFRGLVDEGWYEKLVQAGGTTVEDVTVGGQRGWWLSGDPHQLVYRDAEGRAIEETRRVVGDVLIWRREGLTLRIESALGREATIRLAETFAPAG